MKLPLGKTKNDPKIFPESKTRFDLGPLPGTEHSYFVIKLFAAY